MRLLKLGTYHPTYLKNFYRENKNLESKPYCVQHEALMEDCYGSSDFWTRELSKLGYETRELIANADPLQKRWARENNLVFNEKDWLFEIASAQIKSFRSDVLIVADYTTFKADFLNNVRRECPTIRLILGWCGAAYSDTSVFNAWDIVLSCIPEFVENFKNEGKKSFHINHAFAPRIIDKIDSSKNPDIDFGFAGSIVKQHSFHTERERLLLKLLKETDLEIWSDVKRPTLMEKQKLLARRGAYDLISVARRVNFTEPLLKTIPIVRNIVRWDSRPTLNQYIGEEIIRRTHKPVFGLKMFELFRRTRVVFNNHIDVSKNSASNMRLFEATGVGACLLTDWKDNLSQLFETDKEILTYRSADECVEKVRYILEHEEERAAIAAAGQKRTLNEHTFEFRARQIDEIIRNALASN